MATEMAEVSNRVNFGSWVGRLTCPEKSGQREYPMISGLVRKKRYGIQCPENIGPASTWCGLVGRCFWHRLGAAQIPDEWKDDSTQQHHLIQSKQQSFKVSILLPWETKYIWKYIDVTLSFSRTTENWWLFDVWSNSRVCVKDYRHTIGYPINSVNAPWLI